MSWPGVIAQDEGAARCIRGRVSTSRRSQLSCSDAIANWRGSSTCWCVPPRGVDRPLIRVRPGAQEPRRNPYQRARIPRSYGRGSGLNPGAAQRQMLNSSIPSADGLSHRP